VLRETEDATIPLSLQLAVRDRHKGLVAVELGQMKGQRSYVTVSDGRWKFLADGGEPPTHDEAPSDSPEAIARVVWQAAVDWRGQHGGDSRFLVNLWQVDKRGDTSAAESKFTVDEDAPLSTDDVESRARASFMHELTSFVGLQHGRMLAMYKEMGSVAKSFAELLRIPVEALQHAIDVRMEALEDRIEAVLDNDGATPARAKARGADSDQWKESMSAFKELASGPMGKAAVARLLGLEGEEALRFVGLSADTSNATIRGTLVELGKSLTKEQREQLKTKLGKVDAQALYDAAVADDEHTAAMKCIGFFSDLEEANLIMVPDTILTDTQAKLLVRVQSLCEQHVEAAEREAKK
jgi:hypothetical protein